MRRESEPPYLPSAPFYQYFTEATLWVGFHRDQIEPTALDAWFEGLGVQLDCVDSCRIDLNEQCKSGDSTIRWL